MKKKLSVNIVGVAVLFLLVVPLLYGCEQDTPGIALVPAVSGKAAAETAGEQMSQLQEEKRQLEEERKRELGEFYVPLPPVNEESGVLKVKAKGLYVTGSTAGLPVDEEDVERYVAYIGQLRGENSNQEAVTADGVNRLEKILAICIASEINSLVIDVKNDAGFMTYKSDIPVVQAVGANNYTATENIDSLIGLLKKYDIYPIARIVTFKDSNFARYKPEHTIRLKSGGVWKDPQGVAWVNPFDTYVWDYNVAIAKESALKGFEEIQFDYVRFPANARAYNSITDFPGRDGRDKDEAIEQFLAYARRELQPYGVSVAADVFGVITRSWDDKPEDIGQTWRKIARSVDYICPMIYPSHYGSGWYNFQVPDANPYGVVRGAMLEALERNAALENPGQIRPWLQGFTAGWVEGHISYGPEEIRKQISAVKELGIDEYFVWNAGNDYNPLAFFNTGEAAGETGDAGIDILGRTGKEALEMYLQAVRQGNYPRLYLLTPISERDADYDVFKSRKMAGNIRLISYTITGNDDEEKTYKVTCLYHGPENREVAVEENWEIVMENRVWKVSEPLVLIDAVGHWAGGTVCEFVKAGLITGYPDSTFRPENPISRAEFAAILVKALKLEKNKDIYFDDTREHWARDYIAAAAGHGVVSGYNDDSFGPDDYITRQEMAVMVSRAAGLEITTSTEVFKDAEKIAGWAREGVAKAFANGIVTGYPDNTFRPEACATRAEAVTVISKIIKED